MRSTEPIWTLHDGGRLRAAVFRRDRYRCVICDAPGVVSGLDIHHADPKGMGGSRLLDDPANLVSLCRACHTDVHGFGRTRWTPRLKAAALAAMHRFVYP
jgi:5-methylcytosine-specific restriction endonuclease McrA